MRLSSLIGHLAEVVDAVDNAGHAADVVVARYFRARRYLGARDRRFITEHLYGILRDRRLLETLTRAVIKREHAQELLDRVPPMALAVARVIRVGMDLPDGEREALQELWSKNAPAIPLADLAGWFKLANQEVRSNLNPIEEVALDYSMPAFVIRAWFEQFGETETVALCAAMGESAPTTARVNTLRCTPEECRRAIEASGISVRQGSFVSETIIFPHRLTIQSLEAYRHGWFEMQDEGSQIISRLLNPRPGELVIDSCAGAGGKALHCAALMHNRGRIIASDPDPRKLHELTQRARRAGASSIEIPANGMVPHALRGKADAVLVDAPCSGLGTLRRNPGAKTALTSDTSRYYAEKQGRILDESARLVRPGGRMVYATCTLLRWENEDVIEQFCRTHPDFVVYPVHEGLSGVNLPRQSGPYLTLTPHVHGTDGFFGALLHRHP